MNISDLTKLLFVVALSTSSGVLAEIHRDNGFIVLYLMVRRLCRKKPIGVWSSGVRSSSYHIVYSLKIYISFFSYVFLRNKDMAVDELTENQSSDLDLNKARKLCCAWAPQGHNKTNPKWPSFPTNVTISKSRFQMVCPEASTRKRVGRRKRGEKEEEEEEEEKEE